MASASSAWWLFMSAVLITSSNFFPVHDGVSARTTIAWTGRCSCISAAPGAQLQYGALEAQGRAECGVRKRWLLQRRSREAPFGPSAAGPPSRFLEFHDWQEDHSASAAPWHLLTIAGMNSDAVVNTRTNFLRRGCRGIDVSISLRRVILQHARCTCETAEDCSLASTDARGCHCAGKPSFGSARAAAVPTALARGPPPAPIYTVRLARIERWVLVTTECVIVGWPALMRSVNALLAYVFLVST
jgi:hypothetical protein